MGVETYLTVAFWLGIVGVLIGCGRLTLDHPRVETVNLGSDVLRLLVGVAFLAWVSILKFGS